MKLKQLISAVILGTGASFVCVAEQAYSATPEGFRSHAYLGGSYGGFKSRGGAFDDEEDVFGAHVGVMFLPFLGIEGEYANFGEFGGPLGSVDVDGWGAALVGRLPLTETLGLYAKVGQFFWDADFKGAGFSDNFDGDEPYYGVGLDFTVTEPFALTVEYNRFEVDDADFNVPEAFPGSGDTDIDTLRLGARFRF